MDNKNETPREPRYVWPWYVLAAFVLGVALAVVWMSNEVQRTREQRETIFLPAENTPLPQPASDPAMLEKWRAELAELAVTNDASSETAIELWLDKFLAGKFRRSFNSTCLKPHANRARPHQKEAGTIRGRAAEEFRWPNFACCFTAAMRRRDGKSFFEKPEANCIKCHKVGDSQGGDTGPPLSGIGTNQTREAILESIVYPNAKIVAGYESVIVMLKNGNGTCGIVKRETDTELVVNSPDDGLQTIKKADIESRQPAFSPMPEGLWLVLTQRDLRNLVEFLATLK